MKTTLEARSILAAALLAGTAVADAVPVLVAPGNGGLNPVTLTWLDDRDADGPFSLYLDTTAPDLDLLASQLTATSFTLPPLAPANYFWQVANSFGERSSIGSFVVQLPIPGQVPEPASTGLVAAALVALAAAGAWRQRGRSPLGRAVAPG